ncbi:DUF6265 family protein [Flavobacterium amniphilum]|uniref:DUF6265 family protein n=1 Tax=Flavobacterium amniphilum TaxID=1834035 RepID=UPI00202A9303|nr:DUF6265 family protein [Flavobacterium amniphilum]MCL9807689.1 DUF6265 family protein [Flavobacterium amniphilum]
MKARIIVGIVIMLISIGWKSQQENNLKKAEWLIGTWKNKTPKGSMFESWVKVNDFEFSGESYLVKKDGLFTLETISLVQEKDSLYYIPTVKDQNNGLPVRFALKTISDTKILFENQKHDFPQVISYTKVNSDSLVAEISGTKNGQIRKQTFPMKRVVGNK